MNDDRSYSLEPIIAALPSLHYRRTLKKIILSGKLHRGNNPPPLKKKRKRKKFIQFFISKSPASFLKNNEKKNVVPPPHLAGFSTIF